MKTKLLLLTTAFGLSMTAQNLVQNGDFEDLNYTPFTWDLGEGLKPTVWPEQIIGWDMNASIRTGDYNNKGLDGWNVVGGYVQFDDVAAGTVDGAPLTELIADDNFQFLRILRQPYNGWSDGGIMQTIDVEAGKDYELSLIYSGKTYQKRKGWEGDETPVTRFIRVYEDEINMEDYTMFLKSEDIIADAEAINWTSYSKTIKAGAGTSKFIVFVGLNGYGGEDNEVNKGVNQVWFDVDNVELKLAGQSSVNNLIDEAITVANINSELIVKNAAMNSNVTLLDITGKIVKTTVVNSENYGIDISDCPQGIYLVKVNSRTFKVLL